MNLIYIFLIILISYLLIKENYNSIIPITIGIIIISYSFTQNIIQSILLSLFLSYGLIILLYKNTDNKIEKKIKETHKNIKNKVNKIIKIKESDSLLEVLKIKIKLLLNVIDKL